MKIDMHVHSKELSRCGRSEDWRMVETARDVGLDALVFTNHDRLVPAERLAELNERYAPFRVFGGVEVSVTSSDHVVVIGGADEETARIRSWPELREHVRRRGGIAIVAHLFRYGDVAFDLAAFPPDCLETRSINTPPDAEVRIGELAARIGARPVTNSDAHNHLHMGIYWSEIDADPRTELELAEAVRSAPLAGRIDCARAEYLHASRAERENLVKDLTLRGLPVDEIGRLMAEYDREREEKVKPRGVV